jgi:hypothetical protein
LSGVAKTHFALLKYSAAVFATEQRRRLTVGVKATLFGVLRAGA